MKILVDQNIPGVSATFAHHGEVTSVDGRTLCRDQLADAAALIVRSVTPVTPALLDGTAVSFVGTTTIGTDHLDIPWLELRGIRWASAPGCNAEAAAQYTLAMMVLAGRRLAFKLSNRSVGIVGHGNVGRRVRQLLTAYGVGQVKVCDPPLADSGHDGLCGMEEISNCDVITLHVPLTRSGAYPTMHLVGDALLSGLRVGTLLVNTSRGKVVEANAVCRWLASGRGAAALDVWPDEPNIDLGLLEMTAVATPHVAGYSLDGKLRGTEMVYRQFCDWLQTCPANQNLMSTPGIHARLRNHDLTVDDAILTACPAEQDDMQLRGLENFNIESRADYFDRLRREYPERRDFSGWLIPEDAPVRIASRLRSLGFQHAEGPPDQITPDSGINGGRSTPGKCQ